MRFKPLLGILALAVTLALTGVALVPSVEIPVRQACGAFALLVVVWNTVYTVNQQEVAILTFFGKFAGVGKAGLNFKMPFIINILHRSFSLRTRPLPVQVSTFTKNNVPVVIDVDVQYLVDGSTPAMIREAFFQLENPKAQITSYVETAVRSRALARDLELLLSEQVSISNEVLAEIGEQVSQFGYRIRTSLINAIAPDGQVKESMTTIARADYEQKAAFALGETVRIRREKDGEGVGDQRAAMLKRFAAGLKEFGLDALSEAERARMHDLIELTISAEALEKMAATSGAKVIFVPNLQFNPGGSGAMRQAMLEAGAAGEPSGKPAA